jgi:hypothetical protein
VRVSAVSALVALAVLVLVGVPTYLALRPSFMERYDKYEEPYATWSESTHSEVACRRCHIKPGIVAQTAYAARMLGEYYLSLAPIAREPDLLQPPSNEACNRCHMDLRTVSPSGDLNIPHRAHVDMLGMRCVQCHSHLVHEPGPHGTNTPSMEGCLTCHDGTTAKADCSACHTDKDPPDTHLQATWLVEHGAAADESCSSCHEWTEGWCGDCHAKRPRSHGEDWRARHRYGVEEHRNCEVCHTGEDCIRCHGIVPPLNLDPSVTLVR